MMDMVGVVRIFPFGYAPVGYIPCDGRKLTIETNVLLYSVLGTKFGGDEAEGYFCAPDLRRNISDSDQYYYICSDGEYPTR